jgi:Domain of unknown function (DUF4279)
MKDDTLRDKRPLAKVSIAIKADEVDPVEITRATSVQATRGFRKGELSSERRVPRPWGIWAFEVVSEDVGTAAAEFLEKIEPHIESLRAAAERYSAELTVGIFWQPEDGQGGYSLSADVARRLAILGERVDFYFA